MDSSGQKSGAPRSRGSRRPLENFSQRPLHKPEGEASSEELANALGQQFGAQWLLGCGVFTDLAGDELMALALAEPRVENAKIVLDRDLDNDGESPSVTFQLTFIRLYRFLYKISLLTGFGRVLALLAVWLGAPIGTEWRLLQRAREYLPGQYRVFIEIE